MELTEEEVKQVKEALESSQLIFNDVMEQFEKGFTVSKPSRFLEALENVDKASKLLSKEG